jgi:peptide deformylase
MSILKVAQLGNPVLRRVADPVPLSRIASPEVQRLIDDMLETVDACDGAGLAAPQVHESVRIVVLQLDDDAGMQVWINPKVVPTTDDQIVSYEGCLSVEGLRAAVPRYAAVEVHAFDRQGTPLHRQLEGFPAIVAQHECDHLDGVVYVDRCDPRTMSFLAEYRRFGRQGLGSIEDEDEDDDDDHSDDLLDASDPDIEVDGLDDDGRTA